MSTTALHDVVLHVFLPPRLPQRGMTEQNEQECDTLLCRLAIESAKNYMGNLTEGAHRERWVTLIKTLQYMLAFSKLPMDIDRLKQALCAMQVGDVLALHVRAQNAAIIIRKRRDESIFEAFEVCPRDEDVMSGTGKLVCTYPALAVAVPSSVVSSPHFMDQFSSYVVQMDTEILDSAATTRKAGSTIREVRDTTDPKYITTVLLGGILHGLGRIIDVQPINKRVADEILWHDAYKPWRRSPLWLVMRVTLQTSLDDTSIYKSFLLFLMARILGRSLLPPLPAELLFVMKAKLCRRLYKLGQVTPPPPFVLQAVKDVSEQTEDLLLSQWEGVQDAQAKSALWDPDLFDVPQDIFLTLPHSRHYLSRVLQENPQPMPPSSFNPAHKRRLRNICDFGLYFGDGLYNAVSSEMAGSQVAPADLPSSHIALADFEHSIQNNLHKYVESQIQSGSDSALEGACSALISCHEQYLQAAQVYTSNPEDESRMLLTMLELWVGIDRLSVAWHPLLREYSPEIPSRLLHSLLLRTTKAVEQANSIEKYLLERHAGVDSRKPSIFSDHASQQSLAVRYFDQSLKHVQLRDSIVHQAQMERSQKSAELDKGNEDYRVLIATAGELPHTYSSQTNKHKKKSCEKCKLEKKAKAMSIAVHEWPLPPDSRQYEIKMVVFELACPPVISIWRSITFSILFDVGTPTNRKDIFSADPYVGLEDYDKLKSQFRTNPWNRVTLASTTKPFTSSHYKSVSFPADKSSVFVNNGLTFRIFDKKGLKWASSDSFSKLDTYRYCTPTLPSESPYRGLQFAVDGTGHTSNQVIANQADCSRELSLHEHTSFASLRSGPLLQWLNIAREIRTRTLTFSAAEVGNLLTQAAWQIGPLSDHGGRAWHAELAIPEFCLILLHEFDVLVQSVRSNWCEGNTALTLTLLAGQVATFNPNPDVVTTVCLFLRTVREITFTWLQDLVCASQNIDDEKHITEFQRRICNMAAICNTTFDIDPGHLPHVLANDEDVSILVQCAVAVHDNSPSTLNDAPADLRRLLFRHRRLLHAIQPHLRAVLATSTEGLDRALERIWPSYRRGSPNWQGLPDPNSRWMHVPTTMDLGRCQEVHYNMLDGRLLIDGKPLGRLPRDIVIHENYIRVLGTKILDVVPATLPGMDFSTRSLIYDRYEISFALRGDDLVIRARQSKVEGSHVLEYVPSTHLEPDLPLPLVRNHTHWIDISTKIVEFRPKNNTWEDDPRTWRLLFSEDQRTLMQRGEESVFLVDPFSPSSMMISRRLRPLEIPEQLILTSIVDQTSNSLQVELPRFRLSFFLNDDLDLESHNIPGTVIDEDQSAGTLLGLSSLLILRAKDAISRTLPRSRRVIIPHGEVDWTPNPDRRHISVNVSIPSSVDSVTYHEYLVDDDLGCLRSADTSLKSKLYKVYLHALTSHFLPDPLTGRTGTEEALADLHSAGLLSFQTLGRDDIDLLEKIRSVAPTRTFYPPHKKAMQKVEWSTLSSLSQHPAFCISAQTIIEHGTCLQSFREDFIPIITTHADSDETLSKRAGHRYRILFPVDTPGLTPQDINEDQVCSSRHFPHEEAAAVVCRVSRSIQSPAEASAWSEHSLMDTLVAWDRVGPAKDGISLSYGPYWRAPVLARDWMTLSDLLCHDGWSDCKRFQLTFSLPFAAHCSPDILDVIPTMLALATNPHLRNFRLPASQSYVLSIGYEPKEDRVCAIIDDESYPLQHTPASDLTMEDYETSAEFLNRKQTHYRSHLDTHSSFLRIMFMDQWPSEQIHVYGSHSMWFNSTSIRAKVQDYFCSCTRNTRLRECITLVEHHLRGVPRRPQTTLDLTFASPSHSHTPPREVEHLVRSFVSFEDLLGERNPAKISPPSQFFTDARSSRPSRTVDTESLQGLISGFDEQEASILLKDYSGGLESSRKELLGQPLSTAPAKFPSRLGDHISRNRSHCSERIHIATDAVAESLSPKSVFDHAMSLAGLWPRLTRRNILDRLSFSKRRALPDQWKRTLTSFAQVVVEYQRSQRLVDLYVHRRREDLFKEMDTASFDTDDADNYPDWLLIQIDGDFLARPVQTMVAHKMIQPSMLESIVVQLNMGEGKSSVIVPFVSSGLANGELLVRVVVLKALANQMFRLLVERLGGLVNRRIYYMPFSRGLAVTPVQVKAYQQLYDQCTREGGILVVQPEHILSYKLMGLDRLLSPAGTAADRAVAEELQSSQGWLNRNARDILDESDEILHVRYQLVYTVGQQRPLENHPDRWTLTQQVFFLLQTHARSLRGQFPDDLIVENDGPGQFPLIRIVGADVEGVLIHRVADDILGDKLPVLSLTLLSDAVRSQARELITGQPIEREALRDVQQACAGGLWSSLILLRGLLSRGTGILPYVLKHRRWRVEYGLDPRRSLLAVPYRAKDTPSLKAEFGHPDVAICLTCLSYYYGGLTKAQVLTCFDLLLKMDNPALEYDSWVRIASDNIPNVLLQLSGVNTEDSDQVTRFLVPIFSRRYTVINFYLSQVVFPKQAKEFPHKLTTSGWDLVERKTHATTGFSGTKDNGYLLPTSISQDEHPSDEQRSTDAKVLMYLLQPENDWYICTQSPNTAAQHASTDAYLHLLVQQDPEIRVLLDVGAQMLELKNEELVSHWLAFRPDVPAAVFFTEEDDLCIHTQDGVTESFWSSPYRHQMDKCLVYLDDAHTRGTDLKLPKHTRAAVTLGPKVTKDRLVQGCMRMRQLGYGQSVMFTAPAEIDRRIRDASALGPGGKAPVTAVLRWAMLETCADIERHLPQWADQGLDHTQRSAAYSDYISHGDVNKLGQVWLQQEARTLQEMYGHTEHELGQRSERHNCIFAHPDIGPRLKVLGISKLTDTRMAEEQEREFEQELEQERQVERPPKTNSARHAVHQDVRSFVCGGVFPRDSPQFTEPLVALPIKVAGTNALSTVFATRDFVDTVEYCMPTLVLSDYMRPVNWIASRTDATGKLTLVIMSPHEVNELLPDFRKSTITHLHMYAPRTIQTMEPFSDLRFYCIPPLPNRWVLPQMVRIQLGLFAGQLYLDDYETYEKLCAFLGLHMGFPDAIGLEKQSDGFVMQEDRPPHEVYSPFLESPVVTLQELFGYRRKGMSFLLTHMGKILKARKLHEEIDF
ncbi:hypothetical protein OF83DRAFT_1055392 [Amylostereum chailletii]|nr:hypothetical protein OF83DRAFT_1055392 [Amylostereum chailletii]